MIPPIATYRVQFRDGMTFDRAAENLDHLKTLGISHVYASPIFTATAGSSHGYDVTDVNEIDPAIGGRAGFDRFLQRLKALGLGLILDIVPNHMAASTENAWWRDVLEKGRESAFAGHFDIDWSERLTLPHLGKPFAAAVEEGELSLESKDGKLEMRYYEARYPLSQESASGLLAETGGNPGLLSAFARGPGNLAALHACQHWQLIPWQDAAHHLSYRRFFEVTGLVGLRVEDPQVFDDAHRLVLDLVRRGDVQGLRIDHVDGLADPAGYLEQLRAAVGEGMFIIVEKILGPGETLPETWPVAGTTGYEFIKAVGNLFTCKPGLEILDRAYRTMVPSLAGFESELTRAKTEMATWNFAGEMAKLANLTRDLLPTAERSQVPSALRALVASVPVYRTYGTAAGLSSADRAVLDTAIAAARVTAGDNPVFEHVAGLFSDGQPRTGKAEELLRRWQQLTGPIMAKSMEDTLFYRHNRFLAANEVGGESNMPPGGIDAFHAAMLERMQTQPNGLSTTSTHDTKRGEDARARLYSISEDAESWVTNVMRWRRMNAGFVKQLPGGPAPDANTEWMLYQALLGMLPESWEDDLNALRSRFRAYALKAIREAKIRTDWNAPDEVYEKAVEHFATALLSSRAFMEDFATASRPFVINGYRNSLSQTAIKIAAPGIPDFYQGAEGFEHSLVDPDNRRLVDYAPLATGLKKPAPPDDPLSWKLHLIRRGLALRHERPKLFSEGEYQPLNVTGNKADHVMAFMRQRREEYLVVIIPRLVMQAPGADSLTVSPSFWGDTYVELPPEASGMKRDILTDRPHDGSRLAVSEVLSQPIALLVS